MYSQTVKVNGVAITEPEILAELPEHQQADDPWQMALSTLVVRQLLLDETKRLGLNAESEDALFTLLLENEVELPQLTEDECVRHYEQNPDYFTVGAWAEVEHILLQATPTIDMAALENKAKQILTEVEAQPERFAQFARQYSNCPTAEEGGALGQLAKGQVVPEFEEVTLRAELGKVHPAVVETRFGFHIMRVQQRQDGELLAYEAVADRIGEALQSINQNTAWRLYVQGLAKEAHIEGFDYEALLDENVFLG